MATEPASRHLLDWLALSPAHGHPAAAALTPADWDELLAPACRRGVPPQLFRRLQDEARVQPVPRGALQCIWLGAVRQRDDAARRQRELPAVLRCLHAEGITPMLLKGAHLANLIYPDPSLRP